MLLFYDRQHNFLAQARTRLAESYGDDGSVGIVKNYAQTYRPTMASAHMNFKLINQIPPIRESRLDEG